MKEFIQVLKKKTASDGPWRFYDFMDTALYDDEVGYYTVEKTKLGKEGDFYTSNHVHPVFPQVSGRFFADVFTSTDLDTRITEAGAGDGRFVLEVLRYFEEHHPDQFHKLIYCIIESSPSHRQKIEEKTEAYADKIRLYSSVQDYINREGDLKGILYSNELFDAMPVHLVEKREDGWDEVIVDCDGDKLLETNVPCSDSSLLNWLEAYGPELETGFRTEINLDMRHWLQNSLSGNEPVFIMTVDYGYRNKEYRHPQRKDGSIRGYRNHELIPDPLETPGEMDLTSHIQWDAYDAVLKDLGFHHMAHYRQDQFLLKAGIFKFLMKPDEINPFSDVFKQNRAIQSLVTPDGISGSFQVDLKYRHVSFKKKLNLFTEDPYTME